MSKRYVDKRNWITSSNYANHFKVIGIQSEGWRNSISTSFQARYMEKHKGCHLKQWGG
jgi:hypothetical protein